MEDLGVLKDLENQGSYMNSALYRGKYGQLLAKPKVSFSKQYPILCLHRSRLHSVLMNNLPESALNHNCEFTHYTTTSDKVIAHFSNGRKSEEADLLVGADGIHSVVRKQLFPNLTPVFCGYTYYRSTVKVSDDEYDQFNDSFETWSDGKRFAVVPLQKPYIFWFASFAEEGHTQQTTTLNDDTKEMLFRKYRGWHEPISKLIYITPSDNIIRTEIHKLPIPKKWHKNNVVLLGDSCHATSPNLAQGAGLSIEDAMELSFDISVYNNGKIDNMESMLNVYTKIRKKRAFTVQYLADIVAKIGQTSTFESLRNACMRIVPDFIRSRIFTYVVRYSLGWNYYIPRTGTLFEKVLGPEQYQKIPYHVSDFRNSNGEGLGTCKVEIGNNIVARVFAFLFRLPKSSDILINFKGKVESNENGDQIWTRTFGNHSVQTLMTSEKNYLVEKYLATKFMYNVLIDNDTIHYQTRRSFLLGLPLPQWMSSHKWSEKWNENGWDFNGQIYVMGINVFHYKGSFNIRENIKY
eukprot:TRINITY_DN1882_c0_g1_i2.p1 TRINITY_DN1882_c0_g1~~TRINITY_DN1882_c0_g1_i2.p1  ORF type:complete len:521 (+),score=78.00 TRINITY_DN1882_c0_g1_i2:368-1930(+)